MPIDIVDRGHLLFAPGPAGNFGKHSRSFSIVDRFLEHSRIYVFSPDADAKVFLSSADWMPRNFYRRVEVMFPVEAAELKDRILHEIVPAYLLDSVKSRLLHPDGSYVRLQPAPGEAPYRCQERLLSLRPSSLPEREARRWRFRWRRARMDRGMGNPPPRLRQGAGDVDQLTIGRVRLTK